MGYLPDWFETLEAARWAGVNPWDLVKQPVYWTRAITMHKSVMEPLEKQKSAKGLGL